MAAQTFEDLLVWKKSSQLAVDVCLTVKNMKMFGLRDQIQRSAISVPSNIAEGAERDMPKDFIRFLRISKGSCAELRTQLYILKKIAHTEEVDEEPLTGFINETKTIAAMLQKLVFSIEKANNLK